MLFNELFGNNDIYSCRLPKNIKLDWIIISCNYCASNIRFVFILFFACEILWGRVIGSSVHIFCTCDIVIRYDKAIVHIATVT